jgi:hypothetical protein
LPTDRDSTVKKESNNHLGPEMASKPTAAIGHKSFQVSPIFIDPLMLWPAYIYDTQIKVSSLQNTSSIC